MSTESGIPDFRSSEGLYSKTLHKHFSPEEMVSHTSGWRKRIEDGGRINIQIWLAHLSCLMAIIDQHWLDYIGSLSQKL
ncbi:MAG: hypothetical protein E7200_03670 [Selenomonas ruminantium]|nr:hypothetical protein [Selenomonas ruminantium]